MVMRERMVTGFVEETTKEMLARQRLGLPAQTYRYTVVYDDEPEVRQVDVGYKKFKKEVK